ncbi:MAG: Spy/CpxP family protein refolding chaperone [Candidatus Obscuribacterales bacterium]|nr:Spy/CpxP family protein refolding chaperone [Candidatus Obscuribacterales bacterium]
MKSRSSRVRTSKSAYVGALMAAIFVCTGAFASDYSGASQSRTTNRASNKLVVAYDPEEEGGRLPPPGGGPGAPEGEFQPAGPPLDGQFPRRQRRFPNGEFRGPDGGPGEGMPGRRFRGGGNSDEGGGPGVEGSGRPGGFGGRGQGGFPGGQGGRGGFRGPGRQGMPGGMQRRPAIDLTPLNLTEEQKTKIEGMRQQTRTKVKELRRGMMQKQAQMRNLMFSPDASEAQIRSAREELRAIQNQVDETNLNDLLGIRSLLTAEQKKHLPECTPGRNSRIGTQWGAGGAAANGRGGFERTAGARVNESQSSIDSGIAQERRELRRQMKQQFGSRRQIDSITDSSAQ